MSMFCFVGVVASAHVFLAYCIIGLLSQDFSL